MGCGHLLAAPLRPWGSGSRTGTVLLGVDDRLGSLEKGKDADLLILSGHPLDYRSFVLKAFINGKLYYDREKSRIFREVPLTRDK